MSDSSERWLRIDNPLMWALFSSAGFLTILVYLGSIPTCNANLFPSGECPAKWRHVQVASVNEVGDTLAGIAGVFAFIWLVATVLLQAHELGEQRKEFREQRKATQDMAVSLAAQAKIFEDEQRFRDEERSQRLMEQLLLGLFTALSDEAAKQDLLGGIWGNSNLHVFENPKENDHYSYIKGSRTKLRAFLKENAEMFGEQEYAYLGSRHYYEDALRYIDKVLEMAGGLSEDQKIRLASLHLEDFRNLLQQFLERDIWASLDEIMEAKAQK